MATYTTLRIGSKGDDVKKLQQALGITADGIYGSQTAAAVKAYQKKNGLSADGIAGNQTLGKLYGGSTTNNLTNIASTIGNALVNAANDALYGGFKTSGATNAYKTTATQKEAELDGLGKFTHDDYSQSDIVNDAYNKLEGLKTPGQYQSPWQDTLNETINKIMNREAFSYDLNGDALYQQYKDQYVNQGKLAMQDTMGQAAAMTGGYGNSYAQSVGQQAYQGYLQQLNDKVPELYQLALDKYNSEGDALYNQYGLLSDQENQAYGRYRDEKTDYLTERDYLTNQYNAEREWDYNKYLTEQEQKFNEYSTQYGAIMDALNRADTNYWNSYGADFDTYTDRRDYDYKVEQDKIANELARKNLEETIRANKVAEEISKKKVAKTSDNTIVYPETDDLVYDNPDGTLNKADYADWDASDWEGYFAQIRNADGKAAAETELNEFTRQGIIPQNMVIYAAVGARGKLGH